MQSDWIRQEEEMINEKISVLCNSFSEAQAEDFKKCASASVEKLEKKADEKYGLVTAGIVSDRIKEFVHAISFLQKLSKIVRKSNNNTTIEITDKNSAIEICGGLRSMASDGGRIYDVIYSILRQIGVQSLKDIETLARQAC
jgi:hypothetical protein